MTHGFAWDSGFTLMFPNGISAETDTTKRTLSQMRSVFADKQAVQTALESGDPIIYEFYELGAPEHPGDLAFGTSIVYPGRIGGEYYMTKGHFHTILDTAEVYYTLSGEGFMLTESPEGDVKLQRLSPSTAVYVPKRWAHRSINIGSVPLVTFFVFRGDAGHDYGTIETMGYRKLVMEGKDGQPVMVDNPRWSWENSRRSTV